MSAFGQQRAIFQGWPQSHWLVLAMRSRLLHLLVGLLVVVLLPAMLRWGAWFWVSLTDARFNALFAIGLSFTVSVLMLHRIARFTHGEILSYIGPVVSITFLIAFAVLLFGNIVHSRFALLYGYMASMVWCYTGYFVRRHFWKQRLAVLPLGMGLELRSMGNLEFHMLTHPDLQGIPYDGVVADLWSADMTPEWERFLARCVLSHIQVFRVRQLQENLTGRIRIDHLSDNDLGMLLPSPLYFVIKRVIDILGVLLLLPVTLPLMLATAIAIRWDSPGPALFVQDRVGLGNRDFRIYKFRSMRADAESTGARLAGSDDDRITRVGRFIRKTRLDELPQLWNVLKGDMSLIGPRPEQRAFVNHFEEEIPFYIYRHVVRPGITGWAQVMQGYAGNVDETRIKIQHDFYYIKHFSLWLDLLIALKTVRIVLTGWGAR